MVYYLTNQIEIQKADESRPIIFIVLLNDIRAVSLSPLSNNRDPGARQKPKFFHFGKVDAEVAERVNWITNDMNNNSICPTAPEDMYHNGTTYL